MSDRSVVIIATIVGLVLLTMIHRWYHADRNDFERQVQVGQTALEVRSLVGVPNDILHPGDELPAWGNETARIVSDSTWVYFVFPESQHRFVITFRDEQVSDVAYAQN